MNTTYAQDIAMANDVTVNIRHSFNYHDSCGQLYNNEPFMTVDVISIMCCNLCYQYVTHYHDLDPKYFLVFALY